MTLKKIYYLKFFIDVDIFKTLPKAIFSFCTKNINSYFTNECLLFPAFPLKICIKQDEKHQSDTHLKKPCKSDMRKTLMHSIAATLLQRS